MVVCVNTTRAWRHKHGEVSGAADRPRGPACWRAPSAAQLRVVVVHQPVAVTRAEDVPNRLRGHAAALQRWAAAGADLVMGGHIHLPYVMPLQGLARPMWVVQAGTAVSSRVREGVPNSVNLLRWGADVIRRAAAGSSNGTSRLPNGPSCAPGSPKSSPPAPEARATGAPPGLGVASWCAAWAAGRQRIGNGAVPVILEDRVLRIPNL